MERRAGLECPLASASIRSATPWPSTEDRWAHGCSFEYAMRENEGTRMCSSTGAGAGRQAAVSCWRFAQRDSRQGGCGGMSATAGFAFLIHPGSDGSIEGEDAHECRG